MNSPSFTSAPTLDVDNSEHQFASDDEALHGSGQTVSASHRHELQDTCLLFQRFTAKEHFLKLVGVLRDAQVTPPHPLAPVKIPRLMAPEPLYAAFLRYLKERE